LKYQLPPSVPARILFQCGPQGEDPKADEIENQFRRAGLVIAVADGHSVEVRCQEPTVVNQAIEQINDWVKGMVSVEIDVSRAANLDSIDYECNHFLNNRPWICSTAFERYSRVTIVGVDSAVNDCIDRINELAAGAVRVESRQHLQTPKPERRHLRFLGKDIVRRDCVSFHNLPEYLTSSEAYKRPVSAQLPLSIFDSLEAPVVEDDALQLEAFRTKVRIDGISSVPEPVLKRLTAVAGDDVFINMEANDHVEIVVSSSEEDLKRVEEMLRACVDRKHVSSNVSSRLRILKPINRQTSQKTEKKFHVLIIHESRNYLIVVGSVKSRTQLQLEFLRRGVIEEDSIDNSIVEKAGPDLTRIVDHHLCLKVAIAASAIVELVEPDIYLDRSSEMVVDLIHFLVSPSAFGIEKISNFPRLLNRYVTVSVPKSVIEDLKWVKRIESDWGCCLVFDQNMNAESLNVTIISDKELGRIGAAIHCLIKSWAGRTDRRRRDDRREEFDIPGIHVFNLIDEESITEEHLRRISVSLNIIVERYGNSSLILGYGADRSKLAAAIELIQYCQSLPFENSSYRKFSINVPRKPKRRTNKCFYVELTDGSVDIISHSMLRRSVAASLED
jgi:hypothetical protein